MKKPIRTLAKEAMQRLGYDPLEVMVLCAQDASTDNSTKMKIAETLLPYMYPKLSSVTIDGEMTVNPHQESQAELFRRVMESPELADAAQKLSLAAAEAALQSDGISNTIM